MDRWSDRGQQLAIFVFMWWPTGTSIDAKRSCGVAVPRTAIDRLTLQVVKGNTVETRQGAGRVDLRHLNGNS